MNPNDKSVQNIEVEFNNQKRNLEIEKLQKEIKQLDADLNRKWYKKPQWIMALSPIIVGVLTLIVAWASGFLQAQNAWNKVQEENFNSRKTVIEDSIRKMKRSSDSLFKTVLNSRTEKIFLDTAISFLEDQNQELVALRDTLQSELLGNNEKMNILLGKYNSLREDYQFLKLSTSLSELDIEKLKRKERLKSNPFLQSFLERLDNPKAFWSDTTIFK